MSTKCLLIWADLFSDLGNQFVQLTLFDELVFQRESAMSNLLLMCMVEQGPSIFLSPLAGLCICRDSLSGKQIYASIFKMLKRSFLKRSFFTTAK